MRRRRRYGEHYPYLIGTLRCRITSRVEFQRLLALPPDRPTDLLHRAGRFLYLQRLSSGGKVKGHTFASTRVDRRSQNITREGRSS